MSFTKFYFRPGENELIQTTTQLRSDCRSAIHGYVLDAHDKPVCDALVMLFETGAVHDDLKLISQMFTDDMGQFIFGPLVASRLYLVKVFKNSVKMRELEIRPECLDGSEDEPDDTSGKTYL